MLDLGPLFHPDIPLLTHVAKRSRSQGQYMYLPGILKNILSLFLQEFVNLKVTLFIASTYIKI